MSSESTLWDTMRDGTPASAGDMKRVENMCDLGTPDVSVCLWGMEGWVELKFLRNPPIRPTTPVRLAHWTEHQIKWVSDRYAAGGRVMILLQIGEGLRRRFYALDPPGAVRILNREPISQLRTASRGSWGPRWDPGAFRQAFERCIQRR